MSPKIYLVILFLSLGTAYNCRAQQPNISKLADYNVTVFNENITACGGTVVKSTYTEALILTAAHCVVDQTTKVPMSYGHVKFNSKKRYKVQVYSTCNQDLALLKVVDKIGLKFVAPISQRQPVLGEDIWTLGYISFLEDVVTKGIISKVEFACGPDKSPHTEKCTVTDALIRSGQSGGGVFNKDGELIGVVGGWLAKGQLGYLVHIDEVRKFLKPHLDQEE